MRASTTRPRRTPASAGASLAVAALAVAALSVTALAGPAAAATATFDDPDDDMTSGQQVSPLDVRSVRVSHDRKVRVTVRHGDLTPDGEGGASVWFDTDASSPGPELRLVTGLFDGTDYYLTRTDGWRSEGGHLRCTHRVALDHAEDTSTYVLGRSCLGDADQVRVEVRVSGPTSSPVDWLGKARRLSAPVARG